jgi:hypothetical protein
MESAVHIHHALASNESNEGELVIILYCSKLNGNAVSHYVVWYVAMTD